MHWCTLVTRSVKVNDNEKKSSVFVARSRKDFVYLNYWFLNIVANCQEKHFPLHET